MDRKTKWLLAVALAMAVWLGYIDQKTSEVQGTLLFLLPFGFLLGFLKPERAWRWALILGLSIPIAGAIAFALGIEPAGLVHAREVTGQPLPYTLRDVPEGLIALVPAFIATYAGVAARKVVSAAQAVA